MPPGKLSGTLGRSEHGLTEGFDRAYLIHADILIRRRFRECELLIHARNRLCNKELLMIERRGRLAILDDTSIRRLIVFGDIHGDLEAFRAGVDAAGPTDAMLFLGDYADRGPEGVEVIEATNKLLEEKSERVVALKGNHEEYTKDGQPTFSPCTLIDEARRKRGSWKSFRPAFSKFVDRLSIAAILPESLLFVHGGIHRSISSEDDLASPDRSLENEILWSDPGNHKGEGPSMRGIGTVFGSDITIDVTSSLGVSAVVRSHEPRKAMSGPYIEHDGRYVTISSTSVYGGRPFVLVIDPKNPPRSEQAFLDSVRYL